MAKIRIILDKRRASGNSFPVRLYIYHREQLRIPTGITAREEEWDEAAGLLIARDVTARAKNARLRDMLNRCETLLLNLSMSGELPKMTAKMLRQQVDKELGLERRGGASLLDYLEKAKTGKAERTQRLFAWAQQRVTAFDEKVKVGDVTEAWVEKFRDHLLENYEPNTVAQAMAWVSRALSIAITDGVIARNPCVGVRKPKKETRKKSLSLEKMRELRDMTFEGRNAAGMEFARDIFFLQFYLLGINVIDLFEVKEVVDGRIDYVRHKTGTLYSVKVQPEALAIIEKWRGEDRLLVNRHKNMGNLCSCLTRWLKHIIPGLSTNYSRHTWATMAAELEIPIETISHALGHKIGSPITAIYVAYNQKKVDEANRRVIDYLNADLGVNNFYTRV